MTRGVVRAAITLAALAVLAAAVVAERWHTRAEPLERDIAGYAVIGHEMLGGRVLYADLWERKPPLLYATFAAAERLVGYGPGAVFAVNVAAAVVTLLACFAAGGGGPGGTAGTPVGGWFAAGLWTLVGGDLHLGANQPNAEVFVNAAVTVAVAVLVRAGRPRWSVGLAVGVCLTVASLYEQHGVLIAAGLAAGYVASGGPAGVRPRVAMMSVAAGVGAVIWGGLAAYFAVVGRLGAAVDVLFDQLFADVSLLGNLRLGLRPDHLWPPPMAWAVGPAVVVVVAAAVTRPRRITGRWWVWLGWAAGVWLTVAAPGWFFPHYYQLWLPPACVAGGWAAAALVGRRAGWVAVVVVVGFAIAAGHEAPFYRLSPTQWADAKGAGNFAQQQVLGERLGRLLWPGERFWVDGHDNSLYFYARQSPVSGLLFPDPLRYGPQAPGYRRRLWAELTAARPALIITRTVRLSGGDMPLPKLPDRLRSDYVAVPAVTAGCPGFVAQVRRGSDLLRRLSAATGPVTGTAP